MRAITQSRYGPPEVLRLVEVETPVPKDNEVLVRIHATTVTRYDLWARSCSARTGLGLLMRLWFGIRKPRRPVLGTELSGQIAAVGRAVTRFSVGDSVVGYPGMNMGAYAEYMCLPEENVVTKPSNATFEEAAAVLQGALTAMFFLQSAHAQRGQKVLILGASGGVGIYSVQLAKRYFGMEVTGVCSTKKAEMVRSIGADKVIDYTKEDFTRQDEKYDIIFDTFGKSPFSGSRSLKSGGTYLFATYGLPQLFQMLWIKLMTRKKALSPLLNETTDDLAFLGKLVEDGIIRPVIDRSYPLEQAAEAHRYVEEGHKTGAVVLTVEHTTPLGGTST